MQGGVSGYWADESNIENKAAFKDADLKAYFYKGKHWRQPYDAAGVATGPIEWFDAAFVHVETPGETKNIVDRLAWVDDRDPMADNQRFPRQWEAYQSGVDSSQSGEPLEEWPEINRTQVELLRRKNIYTVEQLAALPDGNANFLGGVDLKAKARRRLAAREAPAVSSDAIEALKREMAELRAQNERLESAATEKPAPARRGRPPKAQPEASE